MKSQVSFAQNHSGWIPCFWKFLDRISYSACLVTKIKIISNILSNFKSGLFAFFLNVNFTFLRTIAYNEQEDQKFAFLCLQCVDEDLLSSSPDLQKCLDCLLLDFS